MLNELIPLSIICIILLSLVIASFSLAPWVPTKKKDLKLINKVANLKEGQTFLEMGCGNGRVSCFIARKNPKAKVVGIELAYVLYLLTAIRVLIAGPKNTKIKFGNALKYDISKVDVIYVFGLIETVNKQVKEKVLKEMKPGAKLISYCFSMKEWPGQTTIHRANGKANKIMEYRL